MGKQRVNKKDDKMIQVLGFENKKLERTNNICL